MNASSGAQAPILYRNYWLVSAAAVLFGTVTIGGQYFSDKGLSLYEIAFFPLLLTFLIVLPALLIYRKRLRRPPFWLSVVYGLIGALAELTQFGGIALGIPVAVTALLLYTQPVWTCVLAKVFLSEVISVRKLIATSLTILGIVLLVKSDVGGGTYDPLGIVVALVGGVFISLWVIWGRKSGISKQHYLVTTSAWSGFSSAWLLVLWPVLTQLSTSEIFRLSFRSFSEHWSQLMLFALIAGVLPGLLLFRGLQNVSASSAGILLLLEPVSSTILAVVLFAQRINEFIMAGGILILIANILVIAESLKTK